MAIMLFDYRTMSQDVVAKFADVVTERMSHDTQFQSLMSYVNDTKAALGAFNVARSAAEKGGEDRTIEKNLKLETLREKLDSLGRKMDDFANNDEPIILAAGFNVRKKAKPVHSLSTPTGLTGKDIEAEGSIEIKWKAVPHAVNYGIEVRPIGGEWRNGRYSTRPNSTILTGLEAGKYWEVRLRANGRNYLESNFSQEIRVLVS